jgi:hypothetical protein
MSNLPFPLTPIDCDLRDFPFMPLDVTRLRDSDLASLESPEACWIAVLLWCASWHQIPAASLPDDEKVLAKLAGFGRITKEFLKVRDGALRGWVKCSDGRLYHPIVAEKALTAWNSKLAQAWRTELARIKKHNQRHADNQLKEITLDEYLSSRTISTCPKDNDSLSQGQTHFVPDVSLGKDHPIERERDIDTDTDNINKGGVVNNNQVTTPTPQALICKSLVNLGLRNANPSNQTLLALIAAGATHQEILDLALEIKTTKPDKFNFSYIIGSVKGRRQDAKNLNLHNGHMPAKDSWRKDDNAIMKKAKELKIGTIGMSKFQLISKIEEKLRISQ